MNATKNGLGAAVLFAVLAGALPVAAADGSSGTEPVVKRKVYQRPLSDEYVTANFGVNRNLGRAWIEVAASPWVDDQQRDIIVRKNIRGLYYDPDRKAVIYRHGATETICAEEESLGRDLAQDHRKLRAAGELCKAQHRRWVYCRQRADDGSDVRGAQRKAKVLDNFQPRHSLASH